MSSLKKGTFILGAPKSLQITFSRTRSIVKKKHIWEEGRLAFESSQIMP